MDFPTRLRLVFGQGGDGLDVPEISVAGRTVAVSSLTLPVSPELAEALEQVVQNLGTGETVELKATGAVVASVSLSAGFVVWMLRAGSLLASLLTTKPAWSDFDPLPIFVEEPDRRDADHELPLRNSGNVSRD